MRRTEFQVLDQEWLDDFLAKGAYGVLASSYQNQPFTHPSLYVYLKEENAIFIHAAKSGRRWANILLNPNISFNVSELGDFQAAPTAGEFVMDYSSVTIFGTCTITEDQAECRQALEALMTKYAPHLQPGEDYRPLTDGEVRKPAMFKISIEEMTGKHRQSEPKGQTYRFPLGE